MLFSAGLPSGSGESGQPAGRGQPWKRGTWEPGLPVPRWVAAGAAGAAGAALAPAFAHRWGWGLSPPCSKSPISASAAAPRGFIRKRGRCQKARPRKEIFCSKSDRSLQPPPEGRGQVPVAGGFQGATKRGARHSPSPRQVGPADLSRSPPAWAVAAVYG